MKSPSNCISTYDFQPAKIFVFNILNCNVIHKNHKIQNNYSQYTFYLNEVKTRFKFVRNLLTISFCLSPISFNLITSRQKRIVRLFDRFPDCYTYEESDNYTYN